MLDDIKFYETVKNDPESLILLKELTTSSLTFENLPYRDSGTINSNLHRLFNLSKYGWINIHNKSISVNCIIKVFNISEKGIQLYRKIFK